MAVINPVAVDIDSGGEVVYFTAMLRGTDSALEVAKSSVTVPSHKYDIRLWRLTYNLISTQRE